VVNREVTDEASFHAYVTELANTTLVGGNTPVLSTYYVPGVNSILLGFSHDVVDGEGAISFLR
jgi:hypothetical protein